MPALCLALETLTLTKGDSLSPCGWWGKTYTQVTVYCMSDDDKC